MPSASLRVRLVSVADPEERRDDQIHNAKGKKYVFFDWVQPGIYHLVIRTQDFPDPILRVDGIEVLPGQQGLHPRLRNLDLGQFLFRFEIAAVNERGRRMQVDRPLLARIVRLDGRTGFIGFPWKEGHAEVFSTTSQLEVWPTNSGF